VYDFGARNYDPALGRWMNVDPLGEEFYEWTGYNYALNNPVNNIDPDGMFTLSGVAAQNFARQLQADLDKEEMRKLMSGEGREDDGIETDYTLNKKTGEVKQHGEKNDQPDRIIEVKKNGKIKVKIDNIAKGILEDGMNLKTNDNVIKVNGKGLPTTSDVEDFAVELSSYVGKEIGGTYLSKNSNLVTDIAIGRYEKNRYGLTKSKGILGAIREGFTEDDFRGFFHTHPKGSRQASQQDIISRDNSLARNRNLYFHILTRTKYGEMGRSHIFNYTNKTK